MEGVYRVRVGEFDHGVRYIGHVYIYIEEFQFFSISKENSSKRENGRSCIQANSAAGICGDIIKDYFEKEKREKKRKKQEKGVCL